MSRDRPSEAGLRPPPPRIVRVEMEPQGLCAVLDDDSRVRLAGVRHLDMAVDLEGTTIILVRDPRAPADACHDTARWLRAMLGERVGVEVRVAVPADADVGWWEADAEHAERVAWHERVTLARQLGLVEPSVDRGADARVAWVPPTEAPRTGAWRCRPCDVFWRGTEYCWSCGESGVAAHGPYLTDPSSGGLDGG